MRSALLFVVILAGCTGTVEPSDAGRADAALDAASEPADAASGDAATSGDAEPDALTSDAALDAEPDALTSDAALDAATVAEDALVAQDAATGDACTWSSALGGTAFGSDVSSLSLERAERTYCVGTSFELQLTYRSRSGDALPELVVRIDLAYDAAAGATVPARSTYRPASGDAIFATGRFVIERVEVVDGPTASVSGTLTLDDAATGGGRFDMADCLLIPCL